MPKATDYYDPYQTRIFNLGYTDGYYMYGPFLDHMDYSRGHLAGAEDRAEDDAALASGDLDALSESERDFLYGREEKVSDYR